MDKQHKEGPGSNEGAGRISNPGHEQQEQDIKDISHVDRQEGEMNNGELGGSLGNSEEKNSSKEPA